MDENTYLELLNLVTPFIIKKDTHLREAVSPHERLTVTLRYLATGRSYEDLKFTAAVSAQLLGRIILETCAAIYKVLRREYLRFPNNETDWKTIAKQFEERWNFPNCLGSTDGKHVQIVPPPNCGSYFWNYKGTNMFIGDEAFCLREDFLKPFSQKELDKTKRIFNYRLSCARRIIENTFGILTSKCRIFNQPINLKLENIEKVVLASCVLHNFLRRKIDEHHASTSCYEIQNPESDELSQTIGCLLSLERGQNRNPPQSAKEVRDVYKEYFNNEGAVEWQENVI